MQMIYHTIAYSMKQVIALCVVIQYVSFYIDFAPLKLKYTEILTSLPEDFEATLGALQSSLSDSQICDILSLTTGHNQKILNCLITQLKKKEDLLDFCASLEKIPEAPPSLIAAVKELRKGMYVIMYSIVHDM